MKDVFITIQQFSKSIKKSISTINLFFKENHNRYRNLFKNIKGIGLVISKSVLLIFNSPNRFNLLYKLNKSHNKSKKSNNQVSIKDNIKKAVGNEWDLFCHVSYNSILSIQSCDYQFDKLERYLRFKGIKNIDIFYTTEPNNIRNTGFHNHFVIRLKDKSYTQVVKQLVDTFFRKNNLAITVVKKYIGELDGLGYILKHIHSYNDRFNLISF